MVSLTAETEQDYKDRLEMPWEIIKRTEKEWAYSSLDLLEEVARSSRPLFSRLQPAE